MSSAGRDKTLLDFLAWPKLLPLPKGEGRGEGEQDKRKSHETHNAWNSKILGVPVAKPRAIAVC